MTDDDLLAILRVAHQVSIRGAGHSMREALRRARYVERRPKLREADLARVLRANPCLIEEWRMYSEDKRTSGGWYIGASDTIGMLSGPRSTDIVFASPEEAVAAYVIRELDSCAPWSLRGLWASLKWRGRT